MIAAAAIFAINEIGTEIATENGFAMSCSVILVMLAPLLAFMMIRKIKIEKNPSAFGGGMKIFISTAICTAIVVLINVIANLTRTLTFQVESWEIYGFYLSISVSEEVYYRLFIVLGVFFLISSRNKIFGILGAAVVTAITIYAGFEIDLIVKIALLLASVAVFLVFKLVLGGCRKRGLSTVYMMPGIIISAITFSLAHWNVYSAYPEMMIATLLGGGSMAAFLVATRNPFVPIFAHFINNLASLRGIIIN